MSTITCRGFRFPWTIIQHAVWLYSRFTLSLRDVEELLAERGITVSYETIRAWVTRFGPSIARKLRAQRGPSNGRWHLDEMFLSSGGTGARSFGRPHPGEVQNHRAESSHVPIRRRERKMQGFRSPGSAQRFLAIHGAVANTFTTSRHLVSANSRRFLRAQAFAAWRDALGVAA